TTEITWSPFPLAQPRIPPIQASGTGFTPFADEAIDAVQTEKARRWRSFQREMKNPETCVTTAFKGSSAGDVDSPP
ncbi:hypothetical protein FRC03_004956, partial [Tulasnella sp. 419]